MGATFRHCETVSADKVLIWKLLVERNRKLGRDVADKTVLK
jgi:hypothetical protein